MGLQVQRIGYALGARVTGLDLSKPLSAAAVKEVRDIWLEHQVLSFSDQRLTGQQLTAFANSFGELDDNKTSQFKDPDTPFVQFNTNQPIAGKPWTGYKSGQNWHSDRSFTTRPCVATFLLAHEIPDVGGDTLFTNMYMAYETLSPKMREIVDGLEAVHDAERIKNANRTAEYLKIRPPVVHSVVKVHPETGRRALFVGERVKKFVGMSDEESKPLLQFLTQHAVRYEFNYRHRWSPYDLLMWDNRCTMHVAISDYDMQHQRRHMLRCSIVGEVTGRPYVEGGVEAGTAAPAVTA